MPQKRTLSRASCDRQSQFFPRGYAKREPAQDQRKAGPVPHLHIFKHQSTPLGPRFGGVLVGSRSSLRRQINVLLDSF